MFTIITFIHAISVEIQNKILSNLIIYDQNLSSNHVVTAHNFLVTERVRSQQAVPSSKKSGKN